jgi:hypothetical protein
MVGSLRDVSKGESSRDERSSVPLDFFGATFAPVFLDNDASSAASKRSRSAFLAAASAAFAAVASLFGGNRRQWDAREVSRVEGLQYFLAFDFAPFAHSASSCCAIFAFASACFCAAASAFCQTLCQFPESRPSEEDEIIPLHFWRSSWCFLSWVP